jgi:hypothetical protein
MRGRARPQGQPESAPLTQVAAGRAWQGDADGGRNPNGATAPRPPVRLAEPPRGDGEGSVAQRLERARRELERLDREYLTAVREGLRAREHAEISAAFDRGDALQGRMLSTVHRARQLERELAGAVPAEVRELATPASPAELTADPDDAA